MRISIAAAICVCAFVLGGGCATKKPVFRSECPSLDADDYYFSKGALDPGRPKIDKMLRDWYSNYLRAMMEPSLSCGPRSSRFAYRFLWLRGSHHPIAMRVEREGAFLMFSAVELDGRGGGGAPGSVVQRIQRRLLPAEQDTFLRKLKGVGFWELKKNEERFGFEGAQWILEGNEDERYQVVERYTPRPGAYRDVCLQLIEFTGIAIPPLDYY
jgi:hypothetical protein